MKYHLDNIRETDESLISIYAPQKHHPGHNLISADLPQWSASLICQDLLFLPIEL